MITKVLKDFDIQQIANSGQCFRIKEREEKRFQVIAFEQYLELEHRGEEVVLYCSEEEFQNRWKDYFDLKTDYTKIKTSTDKADTYLQKAIECGSGIRILRQELWEVIISFLISQQNNIKRIKKTIETICERYGEERINKRKERYFCFPKPSVIARLEERDLMNCNLGYRSKYVLRTAREIEEGSFLLADVWKMDYTEAKKKLMELYGVGAKVADCICLYGLHHIEAFPIDTHIQQMLSKHYKEGFPFERYRGYEGVLQQYAFYYEIYGEK